MKIKSKPHSEEEMLKMRDIFFRENGVWYYEAYFKPTEKAWRKK